MRLISGLFILACSLGVLSLVLSVSVSTKAQVAGQEDEADFPPLFRVIDNYLTTSYLDLQRIQPRPLVERALSALELAADEIYVENPNPKDPYVAVHVNNKVQLFRVNDLEDREALVKLLEQIFSFLERNYDGEIPLIDLRYAVANGYLQGIDPHTLVFTPKSFEEFQVHIRGEIFGVGMLVGTTEEGRLQVKQVLKETPAFRAGFKKDDLITKIDDESTINMTVTEAVQKIRGQQHTAVTLTVKRESPTNKEKLETLAISVTRDRVTIKSVESKLLRGNVTAGLEGGVGYVKVVNFDQNTLVGLESNLERLESENGGKLGALVLDLRGNSGGLLSQAVDMCDVFLKGGDIVITAQKGEKLQYKAAGDDGDEPRYPIVVLADDQSASGAEIVIGALQKNNRALVLGTSTFGKGSVQQLQRLPNGAQLKITVSEYLLPQKISIQETGVVPDVLARRVRLDERVTDLFPDNNTFKERNYEAHIVSRYKREEKPRYSLKYLAEAVDDSDPKNQRTVTERFMSGELEPEKDALVQMALKILKLSGKPYDPGRLLSDKNDELQSLQSEFFQKIVLRLEQLGIDWSGPGSETGEDEPSPEVELAIEYKLVEEPSRDPEDPVAVNKVVVTARATNKGSRPLYRIKGLSQSDYFLYEHIEFLFGKLEPGQTIERSQKVRVPYFPRAQNNLFTVELSGEDDKVFLSRSVEVALAAKERPSFAYTARLQDREGRELKSLEADIDASLFLTIHNVGKGPAYKGAAILRNKTEPRRQIFLDKGRIDYSDLEPGKETEVEFRFKVRPGERLEAYEFQLSIVDAYSGESLTQTLRIPSKDGEGAPFPNGVFFQPPAIELSLVDPDNSTPVLVTDRDSLRLLASITAEETSFSTWVTNLPVTTRNKSPDKVFFDRSNGKPQLKFATKVPLTSGTNLVTIVAKGANGLENRHSLMVRKK